MAEIVTRLMTAEDVDAVHEIDLASFAIPWTRDAFAKEAENNCAVMAARQLDDYLKNGNIRNSVNYPALDLPRTGASRICVLHANIPAVITGITAALAEEGLNIENMTSKSKGDNAYTVMDVSSVPSDAAVAHIATIAGVTKVRVV